MRRRRHATASMLPHGACAPARTGAWQTPWRPRQLWGTACMRLWWTWVVAAKVCAPLSGTQASNPASTVPIRECLDTSTGSHAFSDPGKPCLLSKHRVECIDCQHDTLGNILLQPPVWQIGLNSSTCRNERYASPIRAEASSGGPADPH